MKQSVSLITLGVSNYERAKSFYAALGWSPALEVQETAFFRANGVVLVLSAREKLAADTGVVDDGARWSGVTLAHNVESRQEVDKHHPVQGCIQGVVRVATLEEVRELARTLPRSTEVFVRGRIKFRVGSIVWLAFSRDGSEMGFAFPKEWRPALVESEPEKFMLPGPSDLKYNWVEARLDALDPDEVRELVLEAWSTVVPKYVVDDYLRLHR